MNTSADQEDAFGQRDLVAVFAGAAAVDDEEVGFLQQGKDRVVPDARVVVHTLIAVGDEGPEGRGLGRGTGRRHHHQEGPALQGDEGLAAQGMALHHADRDGAWPGLGAEDVDQRPPAAEFDLGQVVKAFGRALVDQQALGIVGFDDIPERGKGLSGQGFWLQLQRLVRS